MYLNHPLSLSNINDKQLPPELTVDFNWADVFLDNNQITTVDSYQMRLLLEYLLKFAHKTDNGRKLFAGGKSIPEVMYYRLLSSIICLIRLENITNVELKTFCRTTELDYTYLRRQIISFKKYCKKNKI